jgi:hypothetical protein
MISDALYVLAGVFVGVGVTWYAMRRPSEPDAPEIEMVIPTPAQERELERLPREIWQRNAFLAESKRCYLHGVKDCPCETNPFMDSPEMPGPGYDAQTRPYDQKRADELAVWLETRRGYDGSD